MGKSIFVDPYLKIRGSVILHYGSGPGWPIIYNLARFGSYLKIFIAVNKMFSNTRQ
jgi:hypothetical protein